MKYQHRGDAPPSATFPKRKPLPALCSFATRDMKPMRESPTMRIRRGPSCWRARSAAYAMLFRAEGARQHQGPRRILILGGSRLGFLSPGADEKNAGKGFRFGKVALGGAAPR